MTMPQHDPNLLAYLQGWRQYLEQVASSAAAPGVLRPAMPQLPVAPMPLAPPPLPPCPRVSQYRLLRQSGRCRTTPRARQPTTLSSC
jgi:hypothetical protein